MIKYPNITIEPIEVRPQDLFDRDAYVKMLTEKKPDLIDVNLEMYNYLIDRGLLYGIDSMIKKDKFDLEKLFIGVVDVLKGNDGQLYGLSQDFTTDAVYYNKDMFDKYQLPVPTDKMSWSEILQLAIRFPVDNSGNNSLYGLSTNSPLGIFGLFYAIGETDNLQMIRKNKLILESQEWDNIYRNIIKTYKYGAIWDYNTINEDLFIKGNVAMKVDSSSYIKSLKSESEFRWGVVTYPVDPKNPDYTPRLNLNHITSINKNSGQIDNAWNFIRFINSEEVSKAQSKILNGDVLSRPSIMIENNAEIDINAFYKLKPMAKYLKYDQQNAGFSAEFIPFFNKEAQKAIEGKLSIENSFDNILREGDIEIKASVSKEQGTAR
ncbi:ABC transporter substrate-binding protein [Paenibacillus guangzhouensis]|uniref:ABC transporter substrate-binding protein n=1 Tax=Paenibacillus guangzhouensis TaxID=1473112 RepID=UPI0012668CB4|nr:extracellular solute-binding protein [Paenibacillus guangzhouensis]